MKKFYFTFGDSKSQPFKGGWVVVVAPDYKAAVKIFNIYYPNPDDKGTINCASIYSEEEFIRSEMFKTGNRGYYCHTMIGPYIPVNVE